MKLRWPCMSQTQFILLFVGGGVQWWRRRFSERKKAEMGVRWSQSQHWKAGRKLYERMHYNSKVSYGWRWMHEHKGTNLAERDCMEPLRIFFIYFFWVVVLTLILSWRSVIMAPEILKVGDIENATAQGWKESRETTRIIKSLGFFLPQKRGNWNFGTEIECSFL